MMCTCTQLLDPHHVPWTSTFPEELKTEDESFVFMKKLIALAISSITYLRVMFPERAFSDRHVEDVHLKILIDHNEFPGAMQLVDWVKGCFDALEKKYLRQLVIGIYTDQSKPNHFIEAYTFRFTYSDQNTSVSCNGEEMATISTKYLSSEATRNATLTLLRNVILLTQNLDPIPNTAFMVMKLLYYDDVTPPDYEPPGFEAADTSNFFFNNKPINIKVGTVATPFHSLHLRIKTNREQFLCVEVPDPQNSISLDGDVKNEDCTESDVPISVSLNVGEMPTITKESNASPNINEEKYQSTENNSKKMEGDTMEKEELLNWKDKEMEEALKRKNKSLVRCPCGDHKGDGLMVQCSICFYWQHGACFALLSESEAPESHICVKCAVSNDSERKATDMFLTCLSQMQQQAVSMWRRVLLVCSEDSCSSITISSLCNRLSIKRRVAESLLKRLENENLISSGSGRNSYLKVVNKEAVKNLAIPKYYEYGNLSQYSEATSGKMSEAPSVDTKHTPMKEIEITAVKISNLQACSQAKDNENSSQKIENRKRAASCISIKKEHRPTGSFDVVSSQKKLSESGQRKCKILKVSISEKNINF